MDEKSNLTVTISPDEYSAYLSVTQEPGVKLSLTELGPLLRKHGVIYGLKRDALTNVVDWYRNKVPVKDVLIAEGVKPYEGAEAEVEFKFEMSAKPKEDESGKIDYRETSQIVNVKAGQLLAVKKRMKKPVNGTTVTGKETKFAEMPDKPLWVGNNVIKEEEGEYSYYKAGMDGALKHENNIISVFPVLDVAEDVDFNVGNINFKGDVKIGRDVLPDFKVIAEGAISIWGSAIACQINAGKSLDVRTGIVGKNKGEAVSGEDIFATFVENAKLKAKLNIIVKNGIIGSEAYCDGIVKVESPRSRIVGSTVRAARGIFTRNAGSRFDTSTRLISGIDPVKEQEYFKIKKFLDDKVNEAKEIEKKYGRTALEKKQFSSSAPLKTREDIKKWDILKKEIQTVLQRLKKTESEMYDYDAVIRVKEVLYPRVYICIGKYKLTTVKEHNNATIKYSPEIDGLEIK
jgi:uncharacterized protein (DUF342 family)